MSTPRSLALQAALLGGLGCIAVVFYLVAYSWADAALASAYDGRCHWLDEYSSPCTVQQYLRHKATSAFFPSLGFPQFLVYLAYFGLAVWVLRFIFQLLGFAVRRAQPTLQADGPASGGPAA